MITVSIITICYNAEQTIERTLRSVAAQSYPGIEYIVIDGASRDGTLDLVHQICPEAKVYSEPDGGIYDAMNKGLHRATSDYVWFVNAGDALYDSQIVASVFEALADHSAPDIIYGDTMIIDETDKTLGLRRLRPPARLDEQSFRRGMLVCHQAFIARRSMVPDYDLQYRFSSDFDWCIRSLQRASSTHNTHLVLARYLHEGATTAHRYTSLGERFQIMRKHYGLLSTTMHHLSFLFCRKR